MKYCHSKSDVPTNTRHYAAVVFSTVYIPGDERSRTNPGHGYPADNKPIAEYIVFESREEMQRWVERNHTDNNFAIVEAMTKAVVMRTTVEVE